MLKFTSNSNLDKIFEKKTYWISFMTGCGGYILIKSKWFQSTKSLKLLGSLLPGRHQGFAPDHKGALKVLKKIFENNLLPRCWISSTGYPLYKYTF